MKTALENTQKRSEEWNISKEKKFKIKKLIQ